MFMREFRFIYTQSILLWLSLVERKFCQRHRISFGHGQITALPAVPASYWFFHKLPRSDFRKPIPVESASLIIDGPSPAEKFATASCPSAVKKLAHLYICGSNLDRTSITNY